MLSGAVSISSVGAKISYGGPKKISKPLFFNYIFNRFSTNRQNLYLRLYFQLIFNQSSKFYPHTNYNEGSIWPKAPPPTATHHWINYLIWNTLVAALLMSRAEPKYHPIYNQNTVLRWISPIIRIKAFLLGINCLFLCSHKQTYCFPSHNNMNEQAISCLLKLCLLPIIKNIFTLSIFLSI